MEETHEPARQEVHGDQNAISMYGDASVHLHPPPISSVLPERVWMVPYRRNSFFTGRERLLSALHDRFTTDRAAVLTQGQAISGLGGIGKTQVAVEYAYRHQEDYRFVFWVNATTPTTLITNFATLADRLQLPERLLQEQEKVVAAVLQWLATHQGWLLIVDNADELEQVWPALPTGSTGHVLLTTRDQAVGELERFPVDQMDREEGSLFLLRRAGVLTPGMALEHVSLADQQVAEQIVTEMDSLPLALDQAGAYIEETGCSLSDYRTRYQQQRMVLLRHRGRSGRAYPATVASTWSLSFHQVEQRNAAAAALLSVCAFLAPEAIPEEIITRGASHLGEALQAVGEDQGQLDSAMSVLRAYSLVRRDREEHTLSVHRLVQAVLKDQMDGQARQQWAERTVRAVQAALPEIEDRSWQEWERLLTHALACHEVIEHQHLQEASAARLLLQTGWYLAERARYREAEPLLERALQISEEVQGKEHPEMARDAGILAYLYYAQGKYEQAEPLLVRALAIDEQQLGPEHPDTATSLNNLAELYRAQDKGEQAELLLVRALAIYEQQLGPQHPHTASGLNNLAALYDTKGKFEQAEPLYVRALAIYEQQLGPEHPDTASSLNNLAYLYNMQGKYEQAEPLLVRALAIDEKTSGPKHPKTATSLNNLAALYKNQGKYEQAEPLYVRALAIYEQQLGPQHPHTQIIRGNYVSLLHMMGRDEAATRLERNQTPSS